MTPVLVLLHGWGAHGGVWTDLVARLGAHRAVSTPDWASLGQTPEAVVDALAAASPARCIVAGWSLGGQLALHWARRHPQQVGGVVLIAGTPKFVAAPDWQDGLAPALLHEFSALLAADPAALQRRFLLLQVQGDRAARAVARRLTQALEARALPGVAVLERTLRWLEAADLRRMLGAVAAPALVIHGDRDSIVPPAAGRYLARQLPRARFAAITGAAHVPFLSAPERVAALLDDFCDER